MVDYGGCCVIGEIGIMFVGVWIVDENENYILWIIYWEGWKKCVEVMVVDIVVVDEFFSCICFVINIEIWYIGLFVWVNWFYDVVVE